MDPDTQMTAQQQKQLNEHNNQLQRRAQKFGSSFTPMNISQFRKFKIKKASQTGNIAYLQDVLLPDIKDQGQRKKLIQERKQKFFPQMKVKHGGNFDKKIDVDFTKEDIIIRDNAWYLYGVDYMSAEKIRNYFKVNPHFKIEWLNDSSCNIVFNDAEEAVEAIRPYIRGTSENTEQAQTWFELEDYQIDGVKRQLVCRLTTNRDIKNNEKTGHDSQYYKWVLNKKRFHKYVKDRARGELRKTKRIHHQAKKIKVQKQQQSSSGVDQSSQSQIQPNQMKQEKQEKQAKQE